MLIGLDIGGTKILSLLYDPQDKKTYASRRQPTVNNNLANLIKQLNQEINRLIEKASVLQAEVVGIGLGIPGLAKNQMIINCPNLPILNGCKLASRLTQKSSIKKIILDNDLNCFLNTHLEKYSTLNKGSFVVIALGTGIGGAISLNGQNIITNLGISSEIGHMIVDQKTGHDFEYFYHHILGNPAGPTFTAAQAGNSSAQLKINEFAHIFGLVMANLNTIINPRVIILTGGVAHYHELYLPLVKQTIKDHSFTTNQPRWRIGHDQKAAAIGASLLAK